LKSVKTFDTPKEYFRKRLLAEFFLVELVSGSRGTGVKSDSIVTRRFRMNLVQKRARNGAR